MESGVYRKLHGKTGVGMLYHFLLLARDHHGSGPDLVIYMPLRVDPAWAGTLRPCYLSRAEFEDKFEWVGETLPSPVQAQ